MMRLLKDVDYFTMEVMCCAFVVFLIPSAIAEPLDKMKQPLLDESEYRVELEEVLVVGKKPQWRKDEPELWRPKPFELARTPPKLSRMQWFPEYDKDERDFYQGVRDRTGEKPEIKIFEWKF